MDKKIIDKYKSIANRNGIIGLHKKVLCKSTPLGSKLIIAVEGNNLTIMNDKKIRKILLMAYRLAKGTSPLICQTPEMMLLK